MPNLRALCSACAVAVLLLIARPVLAGATILNDNRSMAIHMYLEDFSGSLGGSDSDTPDYPTAPFGGYFYYDRQSSTDGNATGESEAYQASNLNGSPNVSYLLCTGSAYAYGYTDFDGIAESSAESVFSVDFELTEPHDYNFTGMLNRSGAGAFAEINLEVTGGNSIFTTSAGGSFNDQGILPTGNYTLYARAYSYGYADTGSAFDYDASFENVLLDLTPVPEPTSGLLMLAAATACLLRRQR